MTARDGAPDEGRGAGRAPGHGEGDGWLAWERGPQPADADPTRQDQADETTGPWLRHDLASTRSEQGGGGRGASPWLAPELTVPDDHSAASGATPDAGVPPAMAGGQSSVPGAGEHSAGPATTGGQSALPASAGDSPQRRTPPPTETRPAAHTQP
ncbi:hypothetical protein ACFUC1_16735, partial [Pedococcus sp. NPDC057267]